MPAFFLDTPDILPLPSLQAYTTISVLLLSCSVYYAFQVTSEPDWKLNATLSVGVTLASDGIINKSLEMDTIPSGLAGIVGQANETSLHLGVLLDNPIIVRLIDVIYLMLHEPLCIWTLINMAYCCLILVGKVIQKLVFGELRVSEQQHIKDRFWNFVFYKFIFIFGVLNVQFMDEVVLWCSWFSVLGFLSLLAQLCKDRFEYLSFSPMTPKWTHFRLLLLLVAILLASLSLFVVCILVGLHSGINTFAFMAAECTLVSVRTLYVIGRYGIHLWDLNYEGVWENRASYAYYTELTFELATLTIDFCHHTHMLFWGNIILSMASLVILMQLRYLFYEIKRRIRKHKNYLQVVRLMEANFPMATIEELEKNCDDCAICWDRMEGARKLPCGHLFHNSCLRSWLEQDTSCPTCRTSLKGRSEETVDEEGRATGANRADNRDAAVRANHFFHFDGSRYASWLPNVSVQVTRPHLISIGVVSGERAAAVDTTSPRVVVQNSQLETMAQQVLEVFPHMPTPVVIEDLRLTRSVELTMENILDGRVVMPAESDTHSRHPSESSHSSLLVASNFPRDLSFSFATDPQARDEPSTSSAPSVATLDTTQQIIEPVAPREPKNSQSEVVASTSAAAVSSGDEMPLTANRVYGSRFSKSPEERERMLSKRKEDLMKTARKCFLSKQRPTTSVSLVSSGALPDDEPKEVDSDATSAAR